MAMGRGHVVLLTGGKPVISPLTHKGGNRLAPSRRRGRGFAVAVGSGLNDPVLPAANSEVGERDDHGTTSTASLNRSTTVSSRFFNPLNSPVSTPIEYPHWKPRGSSLIVAASLFAQTVSA